MVRPIWLCTCFSKDQAPLVDDLLLTKLIYLKTVENVCSFGNWALEVMSTLPSDSMKRMVFKVVLSSVAFFGQSSSIDPSSFLFFTVRVPMNFLKDDEKKERAPHVSNPCPINELANACLLT